MIEPISVCEEEAGRPKYQVPRFQRIAAISSANTIAKPAMEPTCRISSTGGSETMPKPTAPDESSTPGKLKKPDHITAASAGSEWVLITVATALAVSWKPLTNSKPRAISKATPSRTYSKVGLGGATVRSLANWEST